MNRYSKSIVNNLLLLILLFSITIPTLALSVTAPESSSNEMVSDLIAVYYDSTAITTRKLSNMLMHLQEKTDLQMDFISISSKFNLFSQIEKTYAVEIFVFHGSEEGFQVNNEFINWNSFAKIANKDQTNYYVFLSCNSNPLEKLIQNKIILSYDGVVDINIAFFDAMKFISGFFRDSIYNNNALGQKVFEFAINYITKEGEKFYNRLISPVEILSIFERKDSPQYGIYASMFEGISEELINLQEIANKAGAQQYIDTVHEWINLFILSSPSVMIYGFPAAAIAVIIGALDFISQSLDQDSTQDSNAVASQACVLYCGLVVNEVVSYFPGSNYFNPDGALVSGLGVFFNIYSFVEKYSIEEQACIFECEMGAQYVEAALRGIDDLGLTIYPSINSKLATFVDALYDDWDDVYTAGEDLLDDLNDFSDSSIYSGPVFDLAKETITHLKYGVQEFLDNVYNDIDTNAGENAWVEFDWDVSAGYFSTTITVDYSFKHYGGNQIGITQTYIQATGPQGSNSETNSYPTWFVLPGQTISGSFTLSKDWGTATVTLNSKSVIYSSGDDFKGLSKNAKIEGTQFFPQTGYSQLTYTIDGTNTFNQIFVDLDRVSDTYGRFFRVFSNGFEVFTIVVGSSGYYGQIDLWWDVTSVILQINWGGYQPNGWKISQIKLFSECGLCI